MKDLINKVNCMDAMKLLKQIPDNGVDLCLTDPPYGIGISSNPFRQKYKKQDWDNKPMSDDILKEILRVSKEQIFWGGNYFDLPPSQGFLIWDKHQPQNFSSAMCEMAWCSKQSPAKMYKKRVVGITKYHPTTKPVDLMEWCLLFYPDAKLILDPFMGSWTTAVACQNLKRNFIGCEKDEQYCSVGRDRLRQKTLF